MGLIKVVGILALFVGFGLFIGYEFGLLSIDRAQEFAAKAAAVLLFVGVAGAVMGRLAKSSKSE